MTAPSRTTPPGDPLRRGLRTLLWAVLAAIPGVPAMAAAFDLSAATTAKITAVAGVLTAVVTVLVNGAEDAGYVPAVLKSPASSGADPAPTDAGEASLRTIGGVLLVAGLVIWLLTAANGLGIGLVVVGLICLALSLGSGGRRP